MLEVKVVLKDGAQSTTNPEIALDLFFGPSHLFSLDKVARYQIEINNAINTTIPAPAFNNQ